ncbi:MAG: JAB domain-containing protein, partial [Bacteroidota bacterium]
MIIPSFFAVTEIELVYRSKQDARDRPIVGRSRNAYDLFLASWDMNKIELVEQFKILLMNNRRACLGISLVSTGGITGCMADPRLVFAIALKAAATSLILAHNHPSGNLKPSQGDIAMTEKLKIAGKFLDIMVEDHLIVTPTKYYSFA